MIICVNNRATIGETAFASVYDNFIIEFDDGHKFLYKKVSFDADSNNFTYLRMCERRGITEFDFCVIGKDKTTFEDVISVQYTCYLKECKYNIYKISEIKFPNIDVTYSY